MEETKNINKGENIVTKQRIVIICGPTGTGKTDLALELCEKFNGAIISADSRQVYQGMDIGTGKIVDSSKYQVVRKKGVWIVDDVKVYGYDTVRPDEEFSVSLFENKVFSSYLPRILEKGKMPFLVGGTGFYVKAIIEGIETINVPPDSRLRVRLEKLKRERGVKALWRELNKLDPAKAKAIDRQNPRRIIRAIEITRALQKGFKFAKKQRDFEPLFIGINWERKKLYERIDERVDHMIEAGLTKEISGLLGKGYTWGLPALNTIGYIEFKPYFAGKATLTSCVERLKFNTHAYARRQLTWFRKEKRIKWFEMKDKQNRGELIDFVGRFLQDKFV